MVGCRSRKVKSVEEEKGMSLGNAEIRGALERVLRQVGGVVPHIRVVDLRDRIIREKGGLSSKTLWQYEWMFGKLAEFTEWWPSEASVINEFTASLAGRLDVESVFQIFKCLRSVGRYTKRTYGWIDPTENADRPQVKHKRRRYFSEDELRGIAGACKELRDRALILVLLDSSARIGEVAGLRVEDLGEDSFTVERGKTGQRRYRCDARIIALLKECAVDGVVFPMMGRGRKVIKPVVPCKANSLGDRVRVIMKRAGLKGTKLGPHTLRHTAGSLVARKTMSGLAVKAILQHDSIATSMGYIHDVEEGIQQEVSPLAIAGLRVGVDGRQLGTGEVKLLRSGGDVDLSDLVVESMPEIPGNIKVRPALSSEDLALIKDGLIALMRVRNENGSGSRCVQLMRRMLRRV